MSPHVLFTSLAWAAAWTTLIMSLLGLFLTAFVTTMRVFLTPPSPAPHPRE